MDVVHEAKLFLDAYTPNPNDEDEKYYLPILQSLVRFAPNLQGRNNLCLEIMSCTNASDQPDSAKLRELAKRYRDDLLMPSQYTFSPFSHVVSSPFQSTCRGQQNARRLRPFFEVIS